MMLPILISVSVAPGLYFFCACAVPANAVTSNAASMIGFAGVLTPFKRRSRIVVLPDVLAAAQLLGVGQHASSHRIECGISMHECAHVISNGVCCHFPLRGSRMRGFPPPQ